jgi:hypothetical protein
VIAWPVTRVLSRPSECGTLERVCLTILVGPIVYVAAWFIFQGFDERTAARKSAAADEATERAKARELAEQESLENKLAAEHARQLAGTQFAAQARHHEMARGS